MFTDSHTHLYDQKFTDDLHLVINNALNNQVNRFLIPNIDQETLPQLINICKKYKNILFPMLGLHPCSVSYTYKNELQEIYKYINELPFIGIGEVGIDLFWEKKMIKEQEAAFRTQINWAKQHCLPLIIHSRNSFDQIYKIMQEEKVNNITGIFHCFSGGHDEALKIIDMGFYLGIGGILTFKNSDLKNVIEKIDLEHIVLETDSPYLAPHPMRGKRNEPKLLPLIAQKLAEIKKVSIEQIGKITNQNIENIFF
tara:strand:- start:7570 stop:8331 length:762 start_codon:yes stop_codon:yes gene_type:complete